MLNVGHYPASFPVKLTFNANSIALCNGMEFLFNIPNTSVSFTLSIILLAICFYLYLSESEWLSVPCIFDTWLNQTQFLYMLVHFVSPAVTPILVALWNILLLFIFTLFLWLSALSVRKWFTEFVYSMQCNLAQYCMFLTLILLLILFPVTLSFTLPWQFSKIKPLFLH